MDFQARDWRIEHQMDRFEMLVKKSFLVAMARTILFIILMTLLSVEWTTQYYKPRVKVQCIKVIITNLNLWAPISTCMSHHCFPHISCGTSWDTLCLSTKAFYLCWPYPLFSWPVCLVKFGQKVLLGKTNACDYCLMG